MPATISPEKPPSSSSSSSPESRDFRAECLQLFSFRKTLLSSQHHVHSSSSIFLPGVLYAPSHHHYLTITFASSHISNHNPDCVHRFIPTTHYLSLLRTAEDSPFFLTAKPSSDQLTSTQTHRRSSLSHKDSCNIYQSLRKPHFT